MKDYYIYTEQMTVGYGGKPLIRNVNLHLRRGEILTLIGPNGSGKSTILKSIIQQLSLLGGAVYLDGRSMARMSELEVAKRLSVLMTERIRPELMTCEDVVSTGRYPYTGRLGILTAEDRRIVRESMALVHSEDLADCDFSEISDGQRQRILLARALCQEPEVIVLDEPTSFLDIRHKLELLSTLKDMVRLRPGENQGAPAPVGTAEIRPSLPHAQLQPSPETRQIPLNKFSKKPKKRLAFFVDLCYDIWASGR